MKSVLLLLALALLSLAGFTQPVTFNAGEITNKNYYQELSFETVKEKIFITGQIGGKKVRLLFDTGAPTQITKELFESLKLPVMNKTRVTDAYGQKDSLVMVSVPEIRLDSVNAINIPALVANADFYKCLGIDGVIGSNLIRNSIVQIDKARLKLIITDQKDKLNLKKKDGIPLITRSGTQSDPRIILRMGGKITTEFGFDTGDNGFLMLTQDYMQQLSKYHVFETLSGGYGTRSLGLFGAQKNDSTYRLKIPLITLGNYSFTNVITQTDKMGIPRIGAALLNHGLVTLDFIHHKFYFDADSSTFDLNEKRWPFDLMPRNNQLVVSNVWASMKGKMKLGEQIVAIDGVPYPTADLCTWINSPSVLKGKHQVTLTLRESEDHLIMLTVNKE